MYQHRDEEDRFAARRMNKNKARQDKWQERQERSKLSREEIELLTLKRADLRKRLDDLEAAKEARVQSRTGKDEEGGHRSASPTSDDEDHHASREVAGEETVEEQYLYFNQLPLSQRTQMGLERGNYKKMTPIQSDSLHLALAGYDVLGAAKTGSGKTLCFVVPVLEKLFLEHWEADTGVGAIVLSPTRELALQIFKVMQVVGYKHVLSAALLTGGRDVQEERKRLHAISIIVGTPGRILHHLQDDAELVLDNLQLLCMDEADRLLDMGFREAVTSILQYLPASRQTLMFSATQTTDVNMLAQMSLDHPRYVTSQAITNSPTPSTLCQNFLVCELERKLDILLMFLKRHPNDKIVVFVSTCNQVKFMYMAFSKILKKMRIPSMCLTSKMKQFRREEVFLTFCRCKSAVLFCTDVAARGLDFPLVHWVVQYDCPDSAQTYIHRAGRTARAGARGVSLLMLTPRETPMLSYLANKNVALREIAVKPSYMHDSHEIFVALVVQGLKYEAQKAFIAYLRSVYFASNKHVFEVASINVEAFAKSLGLLVVPDMSELQKLQRGAKNLPWDVVNFIAKRDRQLARKQAAMDKRKAAGGDEEDGGSAQGHSLSASDADSADGDDGADGKGEKPLTRKEKHLQASDMFRMLQQRQKFAQKTDNNDDDDSDDGFLVKKPNENNKSAHNGGDGEDLSLKLSVEERLAGLSKSKRRRFIENPDLRVRDLGLNTRVIYSSDDDDEDDTEAPSAGKAAAGRRRAEDEEEEVRRAHIQEQLKTAVASRDAESDEIDEGGSSDGADGLENSEDSDKDVDGADYFAKKLRKRVQGQKLTDAERAKKLRRLRKLQKVGRLTKKQTLESSGVTSLVGGPRPARDDDEGSNEYVDSESDDDDLNVRLGAGSEEDSSDGDEGNGSLSRLLKAAKRELYPDSGDDDDDDDEQDQVYHGIDSSEDNDSDDSEEEEAPPVKKTPAKRARR